MKSLRVTENKALQQALEQQGIHGHSKTGKKKW